MLRKSLIMVNFTIGLINGPKQAIVFLNGVSHDILQPYCTVNKSKSIGNATVTDGKTYFCWRNTWKKIYNWQLNKSATINIEKIKLEQFQGQADKPGQPEQLRDFNGKYGGLIVTGKGVKLFVRFRKSKAFNFVPMSPLNSPKLTKG